MGALLVIAGCHKRASVTVVVPPVDPAAVNLPSPTPEPSRILKPPPDPDLPAPFPPPPVPADVALIEGNQAFEAGHDEEASRAYAQYLDLVPSAGSRDEVLFRLGLICARALPADWVKATSYFTQLTLEFPQSPLKPAASLLLSLHSEVDALAADVQKREDRIRQLSSELERLKRIDADRQRRP
jgi:hypothetical protein